MPVRTASTFALSHPRLRPPTAGAWLSQCGEKGSQKVSPFSAGPESQSGRVWQPEELWPPVPLPRELGVPKEGPAGAVGQGLSQPQTGFLSWEDAGPFSSTGAWKREFIIFRKLSSIRRCALLFHTLQESKYSWCTEMLCVRTLRAPKGHELTPTHAPLLESGHSNQYPKPCRSCILVLCPWLLGGPQTMPQPCPLLLLVGPHFIECPGDAICCIGEMSPY